MAVEWMERGADFFASRAQALVNPVNCHGRMGKGLALEFKERFPENFRRYAALCAARHTLPRGERLEPGTIAVFPGEGGVRWVVNVATKDHWRPDSGIGWVREGARRVASWAGTAGVTRVASPRSVPATAAWHGTGRMGFVSRCTRRSSRAR